MFSIRAATAADIPTILRLIHSLAAYEREPDAVRASEADLLRDGFGEHPRFECLIAEVQAAEGQPAGSPSQPVGFALYFVSYSTWRGRPGIHLEDLFVAPEFRGQGIGKGLVSRVAARAVEQRFDRLGWEVLDWNQTALDFYHGLGAQLLKDWRIMRFTGDALHALAATAPGRALSKPASPDTAGSEELIG